MPRGGLTLWDDGDSALSRISGEEVDWSFLSAARLVHVGADTPALSDGAAEATRAALARARSQGCKVSFHLHSVRRQRSEDVLGLYEGLMECVDVLIADAADAQDAFGAEGDAAGVARQLKERFALDAVAVPARTSRGFWHGTWTGIALGDELYTDRTHDLEIVDPGGSVDAFAAGIIWGYLREDLQVGLRYANALAAIKHTHPGELCYFTEEEIGEQIQAGGPSIER
jgi:2-dehydro-3-deoxygluconokinase